MTNGSASSAGSVSFQSPIAKFSLLLLAITIVSLLPQFFSGLVSNPESISPQLLVHGWAFLLWYLLYSFQSGLIGARNIRLHKMLGYASIPFAVFLIASGAAMLLGTMASYSPDWTQEYLRSRTSFVWAIFHTLISFTAFYSLAVVYRERGQAHKRFMLLASLSMMSASITRFAFLSWIPIDGTLFTLLTTYGLLLTPLLIDRAQNNKVHPALLVGIPAYAVTQILAIGWVPTTSIGRSLAFSL